MILEGEKIEWTHFPKCVIPIQVKCFVNSVANAGY